MVSFLLNGITQGCDFLEFLTALDCKQLGVCVHGLLCFYISQHHVHTVPDSKFDKEKNKTKPTALTFIVYLSYATVAYSPCIIIHSTLTVHLKGRY